MTSRHLKNNARRNIIIVAIAVVVILIGGISFGVYKINANQVTNNKSDLNKTAKDSKAYDGSNDLNSSSKKKKTDKDKQASATTTTSTADQTNANNSDTNSSTNQSSTSNNSASTQAANTNNSSSTRATSNGVNQKANISGASTVLSAGAAKQMISNMNIPAGNVTSNEPGSYTVTSGLNQYTIVQDGKSVTIYQSQPDANGNMQVVNKDVAAIN
ncbi:hypothetical protein [Fructilactobacillus sanfranciscensis]|uniref:hypothetical protein n=1 Tax=Fructilactobacillus sanfranciscensis TaxID=1625 RepID=UPI0013D6EE07|nr:hypothetical protein [Fructilactobacillus sanfranciscensis]MDN4462110.1 hypothetical protein [Fructilactobacillus sanfranciscensis]NDR61524.1 hypothetical protein [Fructilactobacillus sanfranciscensis]